MKQRSYRITGESPLVMHNEQLADPLNKWSRLIAEISGKRKKTEDDLMEMARREWMGSLYYTAKHGIHIPERCLEAMIRDGAKRSKRGKDVTRALVVLSPASLKFQGSNDPDALWDGGKHLLRASVGVGQARVIRSRPIFDEWSLEFSVDYDESVLQASDIDGFLDVSGRLVGLCDWRPKHGRFAWEVA